MQHHSLLAQAVNAPTAERSAETPDVQFTDAIRAKALELGGNPVKIYNWVRNNIEYVPTYGSIQGADMCLQTKQCNAFDTSSLLIAMFRSCNIPVHYVYGTVEIPIHKIMNWVGNYTDPMAATTLIASGGIPGKLVYLSGQPTKVQMEHVWVEGWIDYIPSRGAIQKQGDTWIQLDPTFKQYVYKTGLDIHSVTGVDAQSLITQITVSTTVDPATGSIVNVPSTEIQNQLNTMIASLNEHINTTIPNATVGDVFGGRTIIPENYRILPASLPNKVIEGGTTFAQIPDNLHHKITIKINSSGAGQPLNYMQRYR